jgi:hypothetical protein
MSQTAPPTLVPEKKKNDKKKKKKKRSSSLTAAARTTVVFNSASCLLKAVYSLEPSPSVTARSIATATGLTPGHVAVMPSAAGGGEHSGARRVHSLVDSDAADSVKRRRKTAASPGQACTSCGRTDSPEWRKGPDGKHTLCNACGLRYARHQSKAMRKLNASDNN